MNQPIRPAVQRVLLSADVLLRTQLSLREFGNRGFEGFALWIGSVEADVARVADVVIPPQTPIRSEEGVGYFVTGDTLFWLNRKLSADRLRLIAQIHSHPTEAYHSSTDDQYAVVTAEGGFSLVVPNFGKGRASLSEWATYRLLGRRWQRLDDAAVRTIFQVV